MLPEGCSKERIDSRLVELGQLDDYLRRHIDSWYNPASYPFTHPRLPNGSLSLIHTCYKSDLWAAAALPTRNHAPGLSFAEFKRTSPDTRSYSWVRYHEHSMATNAGSSIQNAKSINCTVMMEVFSLYHSGEKSLFSFKGESKFSLLSLRNTLSQIMLPLSRVLR